MKGITLIFTESEVGLLHDFIGIDVPSSEFYGRYYTTIELKPLDKMKSIEFLRRDFDELKINVEDSVLEKAVSELDGIIGGVFWETLSG